MNELIFRYENTCCVTKFDIARDSEIVNKTLDYMNSAAKDEEYDTSFSSINLPFDRKNIIKIRKLARKYTKVSYIIVVGIGGSNLGTMAVQEAILGKLYNQTSENKVKILYAETTDPDYLTDIKTIIEREVKNKKKVVINCISKSGTTTETIANFSVLIETIKENIKNYKDYVVLTTDKDSELWKLGEKEGYELLEIPSKVGGRYSVFSSAGLFPLAVIGIDIDQLLDGARKMRELCLSKDIFTNPAALSALIIYNNYKKQKTIHNTFLFSNDLESIGKWYRQLTAESLGKEKDLQGKSTTNGITPITSIGTTDLHSMVQLYLGGPNDKITTFLIVNEFKNHIEIKENEVNVLPKLQNKDMGFIMNAIIQGVEKTYLNRQLPYIEIIIPKKIEYCIGQLLQMKMMEMMFLGHLMNINPFDQPNVEEYKIETKKYL